MNNYTTALGSVLYAASKDIKRPNLNGVLFRVKDGRLEVFTTDGHRAAHCSIPDDGDLGSRHVRRVKAEEVYQNLRQRGEGKIALVPGGVAHVCNGQDVMRVPISECTAPPIGPLLQPEHPHVIASMPRSHLRAVVGVVKRHLERGAIGVRVQVAGGQLVFRTDAPITRGGFTHFEATVVRVWSDGSVAIDCAYDDLPLELWLPVHYLYAAVDKAPSSQVELVLPAKDTGDAQVVQLRTAIIDPSEPPEEQVRQALDPAPPLLYTAIMMRMRD